LKWFNSTLASITLPSDFSSFSQTQCSPHTILAPQRPPSALLTLRHPSCHVLAKTTPLLSPAFRMTSGLTAMSYPSITPNHYPKRLSIPASRVGRAHQPKFLLTSAPPKTTKPPLARSHLHSDPSVVPHWCLDTLPRRLNLLSDEVPNSQL